MPEVGQWGPEPFLDRRGRPLPGLTITVFEPDGTTEAALYADQSGAVALANPLPTGVASTAAGLDVNGNGSFYAEPGPYELVAEHAGAEVYRAPITVGVDEQSGGGGAVSATATPPLVPLAYGWTPGRGGSEYDPASNRTWLAFYDLGTIRVAGYDHTTKTYLGPVAVGTYVTTIPGNDSHGLPTLCVDGAGKIVVVWLAHNSALQWARSPNAGSLLGVWAGGTDATAPIGTYPALAHAGGKTWCIYRAGGVVHSEVYPSHDYAAFVSLTDGAAAWVVEAAGGLIDQSGYADTTDFYTPAMVADSAGDLWIVWTISRGVTGSPAGGHDDARQNVYCLRYRPADAHLYDAAGTDLGTKATWDEVWTAGLGVVRFAFRTPDGVVGSHRIHAVAATPATDAAGPPDVFWIEADLATGDGEASHVYAGRWNGAAWVATELAATAGGSYGGLAPWREGDRVEVAASILTAGRTSLIRHVSTDGGASWGAATTVVAPEEVPESPVGPWGVVSVLHGTDVHAWWIPFPTFDRVPIYPLDPLRVVNADRALPQPPPYWHLVGTTGEPVFTSGWVNYEAVETAYQSVGFRRWPNGTVELRGAAKTGASGTSIFTLPTYCRPRKDQVMPISMSGVAPAGLIVKADGEVLPYGAAVATATFLDGVTFPAA